MIDSRYKPLLWLGGLVIAGTALVLGVRSLGNTPPAATTITEAAPTPQPDSVETSVAGGPTDTPETLPWAQGNTTAIAGITARAAAKSTTATLPSQAEVDRNLAHIRVQSKQNINAADTLLLELERLEKSGQVPADTNLKALRNNLQIARRAQLLAVELAESTQLPESAQRQQRNAEIVAELQQLQGQLSYDVGGSIPAAMGRAQ